MRREGRQHGMVLTHPVPPFLTGDTRPISKKVPNQINGPCIAGIYAKVPSKPTNSSRYTSRCARPGCRGCHSHPVTKARAKAKGKHKHKDEFADLLERDCHRADEAYDLNYDSDDGDEVDDGDEMAAAGGGGGGFEDEGWVLVEGFRGR